MNLSNSDVSGMSQWQRAVYMRHKALEKAGKDLSRVPQGFLQSCESAQAFSLYKSIELEIEPLGSRNTLFKHADVLFCDRGDSATEHGRHYLESMRRAIYQQFKLAGRQSRRSASSEGTRLRNEVRLMKELLSETQKSMLAQSTAYVKLLQELGCITKESQIGEPGTRRLLNLLNSHDEMFSHIFDPTAFDGVRPNNVRGM
ncbi:hypothetical protein NHH88_05985 [Oxalobacteraceae bacterium OTU3CAMAD1]|nr:hypothetical protein NHH88_05985 [Oxalobacteraceae bacterium OTU3CAMAD1]